MHVHCASIKSNEKIHSLQIWKDTDKTVQEWTDRPSYKINYENGLTELSQIKCHTCSLYTVQKYLYFPGSNLSQMMSGVFGIL